MPVSPIRWDKLLDFELLNETVFKIFCDYERLMSAMEKPVIKFKKLSGFEDFLPPVYQTPGAVAVDLYAALEGPFMYLNPGKRTLISAGFCMALPGGYEGQVRGRSGLALRKGLGIVNSPGTIDSDYRGPIGVLLINHGEERVKIDRGDRIAQLVIAKVERPEWVEGELCETDRGAGGFGSTGK